MALRYLVRKTQSLQQISRERHACSVAFCHLYGTTQHIVNLWGARDAIIVLASRTTDNLEHAVTLAEAIDYWLVVLCSRQTQAADVGQLLSDKRFNKGLAVDIAHDYHHPLLTFISSDLARNELRFCVNPSGDLSTKRNLGLLLARMLGWNRIFFMDDDVRDLSLEDLRVTVSMVDRYRSAGMRVTTGSRPPGTPGTAAWSVTPGAAQA